MARLGLPVLLLALAVFGGARATNVPVFVWGKPSVTYVPALSRYSSTEFEALVEAQIDENTFTIVFAEDRLSTEDLSQCKLKTQTCFKNLQKIERKSYLPSVEEPLSVLEGSNARTVLLLSDGTLSEPIVPRAGGIVVVDLGSGDYASHDAAIDALYARLRNSYGNILAIYTGKTASFSESRLVRKARQAEPEREPKTLSADDFLMSIEQFSYGPVDAAELTVVTLDKAEKVPANSSNEADAQTLHIQLNGPSAKVDLHFMVSQGSWEITAVSFNDQQYYLRHRVHVNQHFSYRCNQWEYMTFDLQNKIVFEEVQFQPFWPEDGAASTVPVKFGDAWHCVGFTTGGILSGLFLILIFLIIGAYGIAWMMDIRTMDRFDDPKGKTIIVNTTE
ncbi:AGAP003879-PA-like protein [Anopheles sinensis]|uniref:AGAP003879-PA-like protein n=1 Tax=Anopheles sinensis TaxID=74873 RepID=A0A084VDR9_ANOSI|nr:AGAP003879-PA-like protein [Anopheles sinensis]